MGVEHIYRTAVLGGSGVSLRFGAGRAKFMQSLKNLKNLLLQRCWKQPGKADITACQFARCQALNETHDLLGILVLASGFLRHSLAITKNESIKRISFTLVNNGTRETNARNCNYLIKIQPPCRALTSLLITAFHINLIPRLISLPWKEWKEPGYEVGHICNHDRL